MPDTDPGSLDRLHDIVVAPQVPWWPPAPGWYVVGALELVCLGVCAWTLFVNWRRNRYRREALAELDRLTRDTPSVVAIAELVKRVALAAYPRERVASLTGDVWLRFLDFTGDTDAFTHGAGRALKGAAYQQTAPLAQEECQQLTKVVRHWIKHHKC